MNNVEELGREIAALSSRMDAATHRLLECILGWDLATAREKVRVARALGKLSSIDDALRSAKLSYAKIRALTRVATPDNEAKLFKMALIATGAQLERICRGYRGVLDAEKPPAHEERSVRTRLLPGGLVKLELVLEPDEADLILRAVDRTRQLHAERAHDSAEEAGASDDAEGASTEPEPAALGALITEADKVPGAPANDKVMAAADPGKTEASQAVDVSAKTSWPSRSDGVVMMAESFLAASLGTARRDWKPAGGCRPAGHPVTGNGGERFQVMVHLDQDVLGPDGDWTATLEDGTRVSAETLRRIACDCGLLAVSGKGEALSIGRRARSIPPAIRRALMRRDHGCAFPRCTHTRFLHAHHIEHWLHGGETSLVNLIMLCTFHHHLVHEGGWTVTVDADGAFTFHVPGGRMLEYMPPHELCDGAPDRPGEWMEEDLGPEVNMPQWDGKTPDYKIAVECLLEAG